MDASLEPLFTELRARQQGTWAAVGEVNRTLGLAAESIAAAQKALGVLGEAQTGLYELNDRIKAAADPLVKAPVVVTPPADPNAMPTGNPVGMKLLMEEDFLTDIPRGGVRAALSKKGWAFYDGFKDTKKVGLYSTDRTALTKAGNLQLDIRTEAGQPLAFCALPTGWNAQTYGRYEVRFRTDAVAGHKIAWMLWPLSGNWNEGEIDFPEGALGQVIWGFNHQLNKPADNADWVNTKTNMTDWHTAVIKWLPGVINFILDGKVVLTTTKSIPTTPLRWTMQCETNLEGTPINPAAAGKIEIAYVRVHAVA